MLEALEDGRLTHTLLLWAETGRCCCVLRRASVSQGRPVIHCDSLLLALHHHILGVIAQRPGIPAEYYAPADDLTRGLQQTQPRKKAQTQCLIRSCQLYGCVLAHSQCPPGKSLMILPMWRKRYSGQHWQAVEIEALLPYSPVMEFTLMLKYGQVIKHFGHEAD